LEIGLGKGPIAKLSFFTPSSFLGLLINKKKKAPGKGTREEKRKDEVLTKDHTRKCRMHNGEP
jgi:hypothetical protein